MPRRCAASWASGSFACSAVTANSRPRPPLDPALFRRLGLDPSRPEYRLQWQRTGCDRCFGTGYSDRLVITEVLDVDDEIRALIKPDASPADIEAAACRKGMTTMIFDGYDKCLKGFTTPEEVRRVALDA